MLEQLIRDYLVATDPDFYNVPDKIFYHKNDRVNVYDVIVHTPNGRKDYSVELWTLIAWVYSRTKHKLSSGHCEEPEEFIEQYVSDAVEFLNQLEV